MFTDIVMLEQMVYENELFVCIEMAEYLLKEYAMESYIMEETVAKGGNGMPALQRTSSSAPAAPVYGAGNIQQRWQQNAQASQAKLPNNSNGSQYKYLNSTEVRNAQTQQRVNQIQPQQKQGFIRKIGGMILKLLGIGTKIANQQVQQKKQQVATQVTQQVQQRQQQAPPNIKQQMLKWVNDTNFESTNGFNQNWKAGNIMDGDTAKAILTTYIKSDQLYSAVDNETPGDVQKTTQALQTIQNTLDNGYFTPNTEDLMGLIKKTSQKFAKGADLKSRGWVLISLANFNGVTKTIRDQLARLDKTIGQTYQKMKASIGALNDNGETESADFLRHIFEEVKKSVTILNGINMSMDSMEWLIRSYNLALSTQSFNNDQQRAQNSLQQKAQPVYMNGR